MDMRQAPCDSFLTRRRNHVNVHRVFPFAATRLRVSPSLKGIIKELSVISVSPRASHNGGSRLAESGS
jgi:hypothetical protein